MYKRSRVCFYRDGSTNSNKYTSQSVRVLKEAKTTGLFMQVLISVFYINPAEYSLFTNISKHTV